MKRTFKLALSAVLGAGLLVPALAQDNFPDVPDNHWAFEALARMKKEGLLVGFPDGLYRGGRPASRYEMAVALHALFLRIKDIEASLQNQINELNSKMTGGGASQSDLDNLRAALNALQNDVNGMKAWGNEIATLKRMADTFQKELSSLGVDVEAMKKDLSDIDARLRKLEGQKPKVDISGDLNIVALGGNGTDGLGGMDKDGRTYGWTRDSQGNLTPIGITNDMTILHEGAISLKGTNETGPKWWGTFVFTNMLEGERGPAFGNQSELFSGFRYYAGSGDVYIQELGLQFNAGFADLTLGRVGYKVSPMMYQRHDNTSYFDNERWDNGEWLMDGAIAKVKLGPASLDVFSGLKRDQESVNGVELQPMMDGPLGIDRVLGVNLSLPLGAGQGGINLAYLFLDSDSPLNIGTINTPDLVNRANVYGGSLDWNFGAFQVMGGYSVNTWGYNTSAKIDSDNTAWYAGAAAKFGPVDIKASYREVEANYAAPGDWGRVGIERNPNNIKGFDATASVALGAALTLSGGWKYYEVKDSALFGTLNSDDRKVDMYSVGLKYKFSPALYAMANYEQTTFKRDSGGNPEYKWTTFGFGYNLSESAMLKLWYEISDVKNERLGLLGMTGAAKGGLLGAQATIKF